MSRWTRVLPDSLQKHFKVGAENSPYTTQTLRACPNAGRSTQETQRHKLPPNVHHHPATISQGFLKSPSLPAVLLKSPAVCGTFTAIEKNVAIIDVDPKIDARVEFKGVRRQEQGRPVEARPLGQSPCQTHRERAGRGHALPRQGSP